jgi:purine-cytosine permease-like protein
MQDIRRKHGRDYSGWFLGIVLFGLVMMVVGLMMASARSQTSRSRPATAAVSERGLLSQATVKDPG